MEKPGYLPPMDELAASLGMSVRSLRRRLADSGVTYRELLEQVRSDVAVEFLANTPLSVDQIAHLVGYGEAASFRKALRRCTGKAPSEFRREQIPPPR